jgi:hypothetical protein
MTLPLHTLYSQDAHNMNKVWYIVIKRFLFQSDQDGQELKIKYFAHFYKILGLFNRIIQVRGNTTSKDNKTK